MDKINLSKDKILIIAKEIKDNYPDLNLKINIFNNKIIIKSKEKINFYTKNHIETIIKIHFPENILIFEATN
ncbi:MAG: hypothetical protein KatS3mg094_313 [Candidatus Parcubacteria bacterium]|nr:MAG: hypothetical protein KatS3mg094_313 [Candidatus Parcubacteria bacterium]